MFSVAALSGGFKDHDGHFGVLFVGYSRAGSLEL
jgi:hypothetical protein